VVGRWALGNAFRLALVRFGEVMRLGWLGVASGGGERLACQRIMP